MTIVGALPFTLQNGTTADATQVMADFNSIKTDVNTNGAANGANNDITSLAGLTTPLSTGQGGTGTATPVNLLAGGYRNIARRNGGLEIWQRGAGGAASFAVGASTTAYTADGWYLTAAANEASVVSQQAGIADGSQWCAKVLRNNGQTGTGVMYYGFPLDTDELYPVLGKFVRLSFTAKAGANWSPASGNLMVSLVYGTGTPVKFSAATYTSAGSAIAVTVPLTTTAARYQGSAPLIVPTTSRQMEIVCTWTPVGTAGADDSFYIDDVQLEIVPAATGYVASNFERLHFEEALLLCQRHYQKTFPYQTAPAQNASVASVPLWYAISTTRPNTWTWRLPVKLRLYQTATCTSYNNGAANAEIRNTTDGADWTGTSASQFSDEVINVVGTPNGAMGAGDTQTVHLTADAGI